MQKIFVSGGAGYIGSHTVLALLRQGYEVTVFDNLANSSMYNLEKVQELTGKKLEFIKGDVRNFSEIANAIRAEHEAVIHFAALKSVVDSYNDPLGYYENNVSGSMNLFKAMLDKGVKKVIFSSTGSVYGQPETLPIAETCKMDPQSVYASSKAMIERILQDMTTMGMDSIRLRYFNVAGADPAGVIGEDPNAMGNLIPRLFANLIGKHDLKLYGNQFPTRDGYQIRDYIHVSDLAEAHVAALKYIDTHPGTDVFNLGTGTGTTVMELIKEVERVTGKKVSYEVVAAKPGENVEVYANPEKAKTVLAWQAKYDYHTIMDHAWNWYRNLEEFKSISQS